MSGREKNGRFAAGHKGYKTKGSSKYSRFRKMALSREPELLEKLFEMAMEGHSTALSFVLTKIWGNYPLPDYIGLTGDTTAKQVKNLNELIKSGTVSAADISSLIDLVKVNQVAVELEELKRQVSELLDKDKL